MLDQIGLWREDVAISSSSPPAPSPCSTQASPLCSEPSFSDSPHVLLMGNSPVHIKEKSTYIVEQIIQEETLKVCGTALDKTSDSALEAELLFQGLHIPCAVNSTDAVQIMLAYAYETRNALHAEIFIAERGYRRSLLSARSHKLNVIRAHQNFRQASQSVSRICNLVHKGGLAEDPNFVYCCTLDFLGDKSCSTSCLRPSLPSSSNSGNVHFFPQQVAY